MPTFQCCILRDTATGKISTLCRPVGPRPPIACEPPRGSERLFEGTVPNCGECEKIAKTFKNS